MFQSSSPYRALGDLYAPCYMGVSENGGYLIVGVLIIRILLFRVLYWDPLFGKLPYTLLVTKSLMIVSRPFSA